jgi:hypothetical protein
MTATPGKQAGWQSTGSTKQTVYQRQGLRYTWARAGLSALATLATVATLAVLAGCGVSTPRTTGSSPCPNTPGKYGYNATWQQQTVAMVTCTLKPNTLSDLSYQGQVTNFQTTDPAYTCFNGASLKVWVAPSELPNQYLVSGECVTGSAGVTGTWAFQYVPPAHSYSASWQGQKELLTLLTKAGKLSDLPDASPQGAVTNFDTDDQSYTCFEGSTLPIYLAPREYPGVYIVQGTCSNGTVGTWTFPHAYGYTAIWKDQQVALTFLPNAGPISKLPDAVFQGTVSSFQTDDPVYAACFNGAPLDTWQVAKEEPGLFVVQDTCPNGTVGTWTFPQPQKS